jgi:tetratricopeptide (TPR) repeat protein
MKKIVFLVLCIASLAFSAQKETPTNNPLLEYKIEQLQKEIDELKKDVDETKKSPKDIESLKERLSDVNNRISDISGSVDRFGILLTVLLLVGGFVTYISVKSKAKEEAREMAKKETEEWVRKEGKETLGNIIDKLEKVAQEQIALAVQNAKEEIKKQSKAEELFMQGNSYYYDKEYDKAIEAYQKALESNPKNDATYTNMGVVYTNQEKYDKAIEAFQKALEVNPKKDGAYTNMGIVYGQQEAYDKAIEAYQKALKINPKQDAAYYNMGIAYGKQEAYDKEIEAYQKALKINPKQDAAYINMGIAYSNQEKYDKAIEAFQKALKINPKQDAAYINMGVAYSKQEKYDKEIEAYQKALEINPKRTSVYTNLFELQLIHHQTFTNEMYFRELFQNDKNEFVIYEMLKVLQAIVMQGTYELSLETWDKKYEGIQYHWSWDEIDSWLNRMEEGKTKEQLLEAVVFFKAKLNA